MLCEIYECIAFIINMFQFLSILVLTCRRNTLKIKNKMLFHGFQKYITLVIDLF